MRRVTHDRLTREGAAGSATRHGRLHVLPAGNIGNQMLQYLGSVHLAEAAGLEVCGFDMPMWRLSEPCHVPLHPSAPTITGADLPVTSVVVCTRLGLIRELNLAGVCLNLRQLGSGSEHRRTFRTPSDVDVERFGEDHIVISVRAAETLGDAHPDYGPLPLRFIERVVRESGKAPVFVGQLGDDPYARFLRSRFPDAVFRPSRGPLADFETLRAAGEIVVSVSTFAWLAAWLSMAHVVHVPMLGFLNPAQRPDIDLLPLTDRRYRLYEFPLRAWTGSSDDFRALREVDGSPADVRRAQTVQRRVALKRSTARARAHKRLLHDVYRSRKARSAR